MTAFSAATDFETVCDGLEAVTVRYPGAASGTSVSSALRRAVSTREMIASAGRYLANDMTWHLPIAQVATRPKLGTQIIDAAGVRWTVLNVDLQTMGNRWRCVSRALAIVNGLDTTVSIQRAVWGKGPAGDAIPNWHDAYASLPAKIQPVGGNVVREHGGKIFRGSVQVVLAERVPIDSSCRVVGEDGAIYKINGVTVPEDIGQLPVVDAVQVPWPEA